MFSIICIDYATVSLAEAAPLNRLYFFNSAFPRIIHSLMHFLFQTLMPLSSTDSLSLEESRTNKAADAAGMYAVE